MPVTIEGGAAMTCGACRLLLLGVACFALIGCGKGLTLGKVSGRVTVGGKAVPHGTVLFHAADGPAAVGSIQPDGTYTLTTQKPGDGAVVGPHRVTIQATDVGGGTLADPRTIDDELRLPKKIPGGKVLVAGKVTWLVPEKYSRLEASGLTAKVEPGSNTINFDLPKE